MTINNGYSKLDIDGPPAYDARSESSDHLLQSLDGNSAYSANSPPTIPNVPTNQISIIHKSSKIIGAYTIDTNIRVPQGLRPRASPLANLTESVTGILDSMSNSSGGFPGFFGMNMNETNINVISEKSNACFKSDKEVDVNLKISGDQPAVIFAECKGHDSRGIKLAVTERNPSTVLNITLISNNKIRVSLPSDFTGLVKGGTENGSVKFSPDLQSRLATFAVDQRNPANGSYFIGDWAAAFAPSANATASSSRSRTDDGVESWKGDILNVNVLSGHNKKDIYIETWEERDAEIQEKERKRTQRGTGFDGWIRAVGRATGTCCVGFGGLVAVCFGCDTCKS